MFYLLLLFVLLPSQVVALELLFDLDKQKTVACALKDPLVRVDHLLQQIAFALEDRIGQVESPGSILKSLLVLPICFRGGHKLLHDFAGFLLELKDVAVLALTPRALGECVLFPTVRRVGLVGSCGPWSQDRVVGCHVQLEW